MDQRSRALRYGACLILIFAGLACGAAVPGSAGGTICTGLVGVGLVGVMSLIFYEVGLSEDRDRAKRVPPVPDSPPPAARRRIRRPERSERMRDHPRRLR